jgi:uncharacterized protein YegJ (DUF2314 family)
MGLESPQVATRAQECIVHTNFTVLRTKPALPLRNDCGTAKSVLAAAGVYRAQRHQGFPMHRSLIIVLSCAAIALSVTACSRSERTKGGSRTDPVVNVANNDTEVQAAIAKAQANLPHFLKRLEKAEHGETKFVVKVAFRAGDTREHMWVGDLHKVGGKLTGVLQGEPQNSGLPAEGSTVTVTESDISDWMYERDGKMVGGWTVLALVSPDERKQLQGKFVEPREFE